MNYKGHITTGIIVSIPLIWVSMLINLLWYHVVSVMFVTVIYALLPDIDIGTSKIFRIFSSVLVFFIVYFVYLDNWIVSSFLYLFFLMYMWSTHRGMFHTYYFGLLLSLPLYYFHWYLIVCGFIGYSVHLFSDNAMLKRILVRLKLDGFFYSESWK